MTTPAATALARRDDQGRAIITVFQMRVLTNVAIWGKLPAGTRQATVDKLTGLGLIRNLTGAEDAWEIHPQAIDTLVACPLA